MIYVIDVTNGWGVSWLEYPELFTADDCVYVALQDGIPYTSELRNLYALVQGTREFLMRSGDSARESANLVGIAAAKYPKEPVLVISSDASLDPVVVHWKAKGIQIKRGYPFYDRDQTVEKLEKCVRASKGTIFSIHLMLNRAYRLPTTKQSITLYRMLIKAYGAKLGLTYYKLIRDNILR